MPELGRDPVDLLLPDPEIKERWLTDKIMAMIGGGFGFSLACYYNFGTKRPVFSGKYDVTSTNFCYFYLKFHNFPTRFTKTHRIFVSWYRSRCFPWKLQKGLLRGKRCDHETLHSIASRWFPTSRWVSQEKFNVFFFKCFFN